VRHLVNAGGFERMQIKGLLRPQMTSGARRQAAGGNVHSLYAVLFICLPLFSTAGEKVLGQEFHPTMVETGQVNVDGHVTFNPAFPDAPAVVLSVTRVLDTTSGCAPAVKNVTNTGFDYVSNCTAGLKYPSTWIATLQQ
jgi:hypothetical protein